MTNGVAGGHGEADVTTTPTPTPTPTTENSYFGSGAALSLQDVCAELHAQVQAFLASPPPDDVTRRTQEQTRTALDVVAKALRDYQ